MPLWKRRKKNPTAAGRTVAGIGVGGDTGTEAGHGGTQDALRYNTVLGHPVIEIGRKELFEMGFELCGPEITAVFEDAGLEIRLDDQADPPDDVAIDDDEIIRWLWVDDECLVEEYGVDVEFRTADGESNWLRGLDWDLVAALRRRYQDPSNPDRNWHLGHIDEGYLLVLASPDQLDAVAQSSGYPGYGIVDLTGVAEVRRLRRH